MRPTTISARSQLPPILHLRNSPAFIHLYLLLATSPHLTPASPSPTHHPLSPPSTLPLPLPRQPAKMSLTHALALIDAAHSHDPSTTTLADATTIPTELHYAHRMTHYLSLLTSRASPALQLAIRAQHLRRWELPRDTYPPGKTGYYAWRNAQKRRHAEVLEPMLRAAGFEADVVGQVQGLVRKEGLGKGKGKSTTESNSEVASGAGAGAGAGAGPDAHENDKQRERGEDANTQDEEEEEDEVQILEDCACLVFLEQQFDEFEREFDEEKVIHILRKTWGKMGPRGREKALEMELSERARGLVGRALGG